MFKQILFILAFSFSTSPDYPVIFEDDYNKAIVFVKQNKNTFVSISRKYNNNPAEIVSAAFPELIRYSILYDFFETLSLEILYTKYGTDYSDFSIGNFQMRPSFVEQMENYCKKSNKLRIKYQIILTFPTDNIELQRKERLRRLQNVRWMTVYLNCFHDIIDERFPITFHNTTEKIRFHAAAYNTGVLKSETEIRKWIPRKIFPYGLGVEMPQYSFSDIAADFFLKKNSLFSQN